MEKWIKQASKQEFTSFIQFVAGAKALSHGQRIFIQTVSGRALGAHPCGLQLDLPIESKRKTLRAALDDLDNGVLKFNLL